MRNSGSKKGSEEEGADKNEKERKLVTIQEIPTAPIWFHPQTTTTTSLLFLQLRQKIIESHIIGKLKLSRENRVQS
ncbi:hypothetical protein TYRP_001742 [Tyrophagus putrescentiae]|nr:hypothetical protein TYRP_001742 [Tyrophagus putrescentiae]